MGERRLRGLAIVVLVSTILSAGIVPLFVEAQAGGRVDYLVRILRTSTAFRVRAQAALSLGGVTGAEKAPAVAALIVALRDTEAAVRAASASSLERLGDPSALTGLRALSRDSQRDVRDAAARAVTALERIQRTAPPVTGPGTGGGTGTTPDAGGTPRLYVGVGQPGTKVAGVDPAILRALRTHIVARVQQQYPGIVIAPEGETPRQAQAVMRERSLTGFYLDCSVTSLDTRPDGGIRAAWSIIVQTYPDRNVRSMLTGAATVMGETGPAAARAAMEAGATSTLRNLGTAFGAGAAPR